MYSLDIYILFRFKESLLYTYSLLIFVARNTQLEYLTGVLALEMMYRHPTTAPTGNPRCVGVPQQTKTTTARGRLKEVISRDQQNGQTPWDVYITVNDFKQVMDVSHDTAYRWLERFADNGILYRGISGDKTGYALSEEYASIVDPETDDYKPPDKIVATASDLLEAAEKA